MVIRIIEQTFDLPMVYKQQQNVYASMLKTNEFQALLDKQFVKWSIEQLYIQWQFLLAKEKLLNQFQQVYSKQLKLSEARYTAGQDNGLERLNMQNWVAQNEQNVLKNNTELIDKNKKLSDRSTVNEILTFGGNAIDFKSQKATNFQGQEIQLSKKEIMLLRLMMEYKNEVVSREKILQAVWGYQVFPTTRTIDNFILNFRKYFEKDPKNPVHFLSIRSVGYRFSI